MNPALFGLAVPTPASALPDTWADGGISLRPQTEQDMPFLQALFASVRGPEFEGNGWPDETRHAFLDQQFRFQSAHYARHYADADRLIVTRHGAPIGRFYIHHGPREHRIVDISLLPAARSQGIGGALLAWACAEASRLGCALSLHVAAHNPAQRLYLRTGFIRVGEAGPDWLMVRAPETEASSGA